MTCTINLCEGCRRDITMAGSRVCPICDPDLMAIIEGEVEVKSPHLCSKCFTQHNESHRLEMVGHILALLRTLVLRKA